jgi:hypothetical protein
MERLSVDFRARLIRLSIERRAIGEATCTRLDIPISGLR